MQIIISLKGVKRVLQITSAKRGSMITLDFAVSASCNSLPTFYLSPKKKMHSTYLTHSSDETVGYANSSRWMQGSEFIKFKQHFIKFSHSTKQTPTLLLLDNHLSHLTIEVIDMPLEFGETMLSFLPYYSHKLQQLDVSVYGPVKGSYNQLHTSWIRENSGKVLGIEHIRMLAGKALLRGATPENIVAGFRASNICPLDPVIFYSFQTIFS